VALGSRKFSLPCNSLAIWPRWVFRVFLRGGDGSRTTRVGRSSNGLRLGESVFVLPAYGLILFHSLAPGLTTPPPPPSPNWLGFGLCSLSWCVVSISFVSQLYSILSVLFHFVPTTIINNPIVSSSFLGAHLFCLLEIFYL
jgi:hypothetical protein